MNKQEIKEKIELFIENSLVEPCDRNYLIARNKQRYIGDSGKKEHVVFHSEDYDFSNEQIDYLIKYYSSLPLKEKKDFVDICLDLFKKDPWNYQKIIIPLLVHLGVFSEIFSLIKKWPIKIQNRGTFTSIIGNLNEILKYEYSIFSQEQIGIMRKWILDTFDKKNSLGKELNRLASIYRELIRTLVSFQAKLNVVSTRFLKNEIDSFFNPEINVDRNELQEKISRYKLPKDLSEVIDNIDKMITAASSGFEFQNCINKIRTFTERLYKSIALNLDAEEGIKLNEKDSEKVSKFFQKKKFISQEQGNLLVAIRHFLSNWGTHRLKSSPEDARLSRNIVIEFSLYLMKRLDTLKTETSKQEA